MSQRPIIFTILGLLFVANAGNAAIITASGATGTGTFNNSPSLIINGVFPGEGSTWTDPTNVWWNGTAPKLANIVQ